MEPVILCPAHRGDLTSVREPFAQALTTPSEFQNILLWKMGVSPRYWV